MVGKLPEITGRANHNYWCRIHWHHMVNCCQISSYSYVNILWMWL